MVETETNYKSFKDLKPTTMVVCMSLNSDVNLGCIFNFLPIYWVKDKLPRSGKDKLPRSGKDKLPVIPITGTIISAKFMGHARGLVVTPSCFKNSITMTMSTGIKNVCIKLYKDSIHVCGIDSNETISIVKDKVVELILGIRMLSEYCCKNAEKIKALRFLGEDGIILYKGKPIVYEDYDVRILELLWEQRLHLSQEDYYMFINWIISSPYICNEDLAVVDVEKAMVNYNYEIGFRIIKPNVEEFLDGLDGFQCRYDPNNCFVTISLPYEATFKVIKKKKKTRHTFMLYNTGKITQSGPNETLMEEAYNRFMKTILSIKDKIISDKE